jgi:hypothetical protein
LPGITFIDTQGNSFIIRTFVVIRAPIDVKGSGLNNDAVKLVARHPDTSALRAIIDFDPSAISSHEFDVASGAVHVVFSAGDEPGHARVRFESIGKDDNSGHHNVVSQNWQVCCLHHCMLGNLFGVISTSVALQNEAVSASA